MPNIGQQAEAFAAKHLQSLGYEILEKNWRTSMGELDLVARDDNELVFIEVKSLSNPGAFDPIDHITPKKIQTLVRLAQSYTSQQVADTDQRIDIVLVYCNTTPWSLEHIKDAISI